MTTNNTTELGIGHGIEYMARRIEALGDYLATARIDLCDAQREIVNLKTELQQRGTRYLGPRYYVGGAGLDLQPGDIVVVGTDGKLRPE